MEPGYTQSIETALKNSHDTTERRVSGTDFGTFPDEVVGVIGEGKMGTGIFHYLANFDFKLVWLVSPNADVEKLIKQFNRKINRAFDAGIIGKEAFEKLKQTVISGRKESLSECGFIIEAVPEDAPLKRALFSELDGFVNRSCIFASNASSINPSLLIPSTARSDKFIGLHFFYPVALKNIVEFIATGQTSEQTIDRTGRFLKKIERNFIRLKESDGFILNRIFLDVQNEAFRLVQEGRCTYAQMDEIVKTRLFPFGVFDFCDSVGIDTMLASVKNYTSDYPHKMHYAPFTDKLQALCSQGRLGLKTNCGFYDYPLVPEDPGTPDEAEELASHLRFTYLSAAKRFTALAHLPVGEMNDAIKEYFGIEYGPFD
jgi:3-hydroxybutyryl-CoA dehydrogenase